MAKKHILDMTVVIDDFIGGKKGRKMIEDLNKIGELGSGWEQLEIEKIQAAVLQKLEGKKYDLMLLVESGGPFILGSREMLSHADRVHSLPLSMHYRRPNARVDKSYYTATIDDASKALDDLGDIVTTSKKIALVDGDIGNRNYSMNRLRAIKSAIKSKNPGAEIDVIVGVVNNKFRNSNLIDIVGYYVEYVAKLSDIVNNKLGVGTEKDWGETVHGDTIQKLIRYWRRRKTLPILVD